MIKVEISGRSVLQSAEAVKVVKAALKAARVFTARVSVALVSNLVIRKWNKLYRNKDKETDVLSFGFIHPSADEKKWKKVGELLISESVARKNAKNKKLSLKDELRILLVHGALHLAGYDHEKIDEEREMFALQDKILKSL